MGTSLRFIDCHHKLRNVAESRASLDIYERFSVEKYCIIEDLYIINQEYVKRIKKVILNELRNVTDLPRQL
jgi:hypothetical protein